MESQKHYEVLIEKISQVYWEAKNQAEKAIRQQLTDGYWMIGKYVVEYEQKGKIRAEYGKKLLSQIAKDLKLKLGKGFSRSNVNYMRLFYLRYPNRTDVSVQLTWSHIIELILIENKLERNFYEKQAILEKWSVRELKRQKATGLFQRLALSKDKNGILALAKQGYQVQNSEELVKDPYVLEFLQLPENSLYSEKELESKLIHQMEKFLLELGKGFCFVGRQYRISLNNTHFYVDLVFYHRILKCFVLIDLKIKRVAHQDIGQMNMYLNYFAEEEQTQDDNAPIGIILTSEKDDVVVKYALGGMSNNLFVSKYQLYLPDKHQLQEKVKEILET